MEIGLVKARGLGFAHPVSCRLNPGVTWLSGSNAMGLATMLQWWSLSRVPTYGTLFVDEQKWQDLTPRRQAYYRRKIGFKPRVDTLPEHIRVERALAYWAALWECDDPAFTAKNVMEDWGLDLIADRRLGTLSLGEQQRLLLAASSLMDPEVWILEEPWNGLDTEARVLLMDRIMRMPPDGSVVVSDVAWPGDLLEWDCHGDITGCEVIWVYR
ncbi:MAG: hypothetical protein C7B46_05035 [Sulfobacillus benefaciens]|uniref:ABC transporter domain-containing protein n=1 Tax=Sulfobacillus benefaciens TaxID=453960 RepID=A0A2T2XJ14_9FIRM|nr:MAG: hypothetical protein C7B46_05035 [Sulfobacillus benefaciens]